MPILFKTQVNRTAKMPIPARRARGGGLCGFCNQAERVPAKHQKTGRCADVRELWRKMLVLARTAVGKAACGKRGKRRNGQNRGILDAAARKQDKPLSREDAESLQNVVSYIADHYAFDISLERLASIACMSETKLKGCFRRQFGCSVTQYIQGRRMSQAEHLLIETDFTMGQIAQMIGYTTSSRFAVLFKKSTGILPIEYRKIARRE